MHLRIDESMIELCSQVMCQRHAILRFVKCKTPYDRSMNQKVPVPTQTTNETLLLCVLPGSTCYIQYSNRLQSRIILVNYGFTDSFPESESKLKNADLTPTHVYTTGFTNFDAAQHHYSTLGAPGGRRCCCSQYNSLQKWIPRCP